MNKNQHVTPRPDGQWQVKGEGNTRATAVTSTQREAISIAREIARNQQSELVIHGKDGRIREKDSHGNDPFPPKG
jgi:uncharacterized protein YdaT